MNKGAGARLRAAGPVFTLGPMLILPPGHGHATQLARRLRTREQWMIGGVLAAVVALVAAVVISIAVAGHASGNGCVDVTIPYSTGGQELYRCGPQARAMCALVGVPGGYTGALASAVAAECRKAGLPAG